MNQAQAAALLAAFNSLQPYVPPINLTSVAQSDAMRIIVAIANGQATCEVKFNLAEVPQNVAGDTPLKLKPSRKRSKK